MAILCHRIVTKGLRGICTANQSTALRAPEAATELAPARVLGPCPGHSTPGAAGGGVRQAAVEPGRQEEENSGRPALKSSTLLLAALQQLQQITSGALESREGLEGEGFPVLGREEGVWGRAGEQWLGRCRLSGVYPLRAERRLSCLSGVPSSSPLQPPAPPRSLRPTR